MPELRREGAQVVAYLGPSQELDAILPPPGVRACRVAPDELLLLALGGSGPAPEGTATLVIEQTDAFAVFGLTGPGAEDVFARLSAIPLADGRPVFLQGDVAGVPAKVIAEPDRILLLVASTVAHHLEERFAAVTR